MRTFPIGVPRVGSARVDGVESGPIASVIGMSADRRRQDWGSSRQGGDIAAVTTAQSAATKQYTKQGGDGEDDRNRNSKGGSKAGACGRTRRLVNRGYIALARCRFGSVRGSLVRFGSWFTRPMTVQFGSDMFTPVLVMRTIIIVPGVGCLKPGLCPTRVVLQPKFNSGICVCPAAVGMLVCRTDCQSRIFVTTRFLLPEGGSPVLGYFQI